MNEISAKSMHDRDDFRLFYDEESGADLVNGEKNLGATKYDINRSKGEKDLNDWKDQISTKDSTKTNEEYFDINPEYGRVRLTAYDWEGNDFYNYDFCVNKSNCAFIITSAE